MLKKYFTKAKDRRRSSQDHDNADFVSPNNVGSEHIEKRHSLHSSLSFCDDAFLEELAAERSVDGDELSIDSVLNAETNDEDIFNFHSRLSMPLSAIVGDPRCLSYFVQFLEGRHAIALVKFYLDTSNFKRAAIAQLCLKKSNVRETASEAAAYSDTCSEVVEEEQSEDKSSTVPELKSLYDLSMRQPLTDDEKSQLYADASKQLNKCRSELSLADNDDDADGINAISLRDASTIYQKYLSLDAKQSVQLPVAILSQISLLLCQRVDAEERLISANCFDEAQRWVLQQLEQLHWNEFLQSTYYCKYCVDLIEGGSESPLNIYDILYSEAALFFFMEFLEQRQERACLDFWTQGINYRQSFDSATGVQVAAAQADAMIIYEKYFSLQAECRLWLSDKLRCHVEERICVNNEQVAHCYDLPLRLTAQYLQRKQLSCFLQSSLFANYLAELKSKLQEAEVLPPHEPVVPVTHAASAEVKVQFRQHRKTRSEGGSISQHNTLLAMDTSRLRHLHATAGVANLNIDARQLTEPQLLWHRRHSATGSGAGLKFGSINALGRYERDFDTVDMASWGHNRLNNWSLTASGNKIKNVMRKFVKLPEEKVQEEIAWQVAEMIVKDVTNITLNSSSKTQSSIANL